MAARRDRNGKTITIGKAKAIAKVQKALDRTENRIPGNTQLKTGIKNNKIVVRDEYMSKPVRVRGSNKSAAKANTPTRTPGVKKNKSLQRSINNSNKNLKDIKKVKANPTTPKVPVKPKGGRGVRGGMGLGGGGALRSYNR